MDDEAMKAFVAGQDAAFREKAFLWARDENISNEEFRKALEDVLFRISMDRIAFGGILAEKAVDTKSADDVE